MTRLDDKLRPKAKALIAKYGVAATVKVFSAEVYTPGSSSVGRTETDVSVKITPPEAYESRLVDGDTIRSTDLRVYLAAKDLTFTPATGQRLTLASKVFTVMSVTEHWTGEQIGLYELQLRGGSPA